MGTGSIRLIHSDKEHSPKIRGSSSFIIKQFSERFGLLLFLFLPSPFPFPVPSSSSAFPSPAPSLSPFPSFRLLLFLFFYFYLVCPAGYRCDWVIKGLAVADPGGRASRGSAPPPLWATIGCLTLGPKLDPPPFFCL